MKTHFGSPMILKPCAQLFTANSYTHICFVALNLFGDEYDINV